MRIPYQLSPTMSFSDIEAICSKLDALASASQYGWGHTIDFGPFIQPGILGSVYLEIAEQLDTRGWWPLSFENMQVADVGCFTGD